MGLFSPSKVTTTSKTDPYAGLPHFATQYYKNDAKTGQKIINQAGRIAGQRGPNSIVGLTQDENAATQSMIRENRQAQGLLDQSKNTVIGANNEADRLEALGIGVMDGGMRDARSFNNRGLAELQRGERNAYGYMDQAEDALGGERYESGYTDDVVNTTLAGMDRNAMRERAERGASEASFGGLSSTRGGVADALAGQLHGMDRAQTEAGLRDQAFKFASEMGLSEAEFFRAMGGDAYSMGSGEADYMRAIGGDSYDMASDKAGYYSDMADGRASRGLNEAGVLEDLATSGVGLQSEASKWQATRGENRRAIQQKRKDLPMDNLSWYADVFNSSRGLPSTGAGTTTGTQPGPSMASKILGAASTAAGIWSAL